MSDDNWKRWKMPTSERKQWGEQMAKGIKTNRKRNKENRTDRRAAFETAQKCTDTMGKAVESMMSEKMDKTNRTTGGERIKEVSKMTMKWMGREEG
jgi:L-lysine 2,3-aminomutase